MVIVLKRIAMSVMVVCFLMCFFCCCDVWAMENVDNIASAADISQTLNYGELDNVLNQLNSYFQENYGTFAIGEFWNQIKQGNLDFDFTDFFYMILDLFFGDMNDCLIILVQLLALVIITAFIGNFEIAFQGQTANFASKIIYLVLAGVALQAFVICGNSVTDAVTLMTDFLYAIIPILLTLFVAMGGITSIGLYNPLLMFAVMTAMNLINYFILPLVYCNAGLSVVSKLSNDFDLSKLGKLMRTVALGVLALTFTLFTTVVAIVGLGSASMDGIAMKTAKSALGIFVPIVGRSVADLWGTLMGTALVLKNCLGIAGVLMIIAICMVPAIKTLIMSWIFKLCGALAEPMGNKEISGILSDLGGVLTVMFAVVTACGIFFFFLLAITMAMGNINMAVS